MPDRWLQIEELYHRVLDLDQSQRLAFLRDACAGDDALRSEVESLLMCQSEADRLLEKHAIDLAGQSLVEGVRSVSNGQQIGSYTIQGLLGAGGMGQVYHAWDSKLKRDVAIKVLPAEFWQDVKRVRRFRREAEVLASLNHPNINAIYDLEEFESSQFLVLELVNGDTLADRIARGPIPLNEALPIAKQIVEALEAAHEKGIIHRDLKPANIKITPNGNVKVLDFGLAKAFAAVGESPSLSNSPTISALATKQGIILGTAAYMSPEQANGVEVDRRSDIFSFGAVFYEMLTGRQAFHGDTASEILACVMKTEPDWTRLHTDTPSAIQRLLQRALRKDRNRRLQTARDVLIEIEDANAEPDRIGGRPEASRKLERLAFAAAALLLAIVMTVAFSLVYFRPAADAPEVRLDIVTATEADSALSSFDISPDGRRLVYSSATLDGSRLWLRSLDSTTPQPLPGTNGAAYPFWSPDSQSVGFFAAGKLMRVDVGGGLPQTIANAPSGRGGAWSDEGVILFAPYQTGNLFRVPASGGQAVAVTKDDDRKRNHHRFPQFLPGGRQFLFYAYAFLEENSPETAGIYIGSLDSQEVRLIAQSDSAGLYIPSGWLFYVRQGILSGQRFDLRRSQIRGDPISIASPVFYEPRIGKGPFAVSPTGIIAFRGGGTGRRQLTWFDRSGKPLGTVGEPDENFLSAFSISPDGRRVAAHRRVQGNLDVWLMDDIHLTRFTFDPATGGNPTWSADGARVIYNRGGKMYQKSADGSGSEELLTEAASTVNANDFSRDGAYFLYFTAGKDTRNDLWVIPLKGDRKPFPFLQTKFAEIAGRFSPDGHWVAYQSDESGKMEIYIRPFPGPGGQWQVSSGGGIGPRWSPDGKELYFLDPSGSILASSITIRGQAVERGKPTFLFQPRIADGGTTTGRAQYDVSRDGRFLINVLVDESSDKITAILNWKPPEK